MKRYAAALLIALAAAHVSAQTIYRKADVQYPQRDLAPLTILEESTPDLTVYVQEDGIAYTNIAGYTCTFRAAPTPTNSAWIVVTNSTLDTAAGSFLLPFEVADTATNTAGAAWWYTIIVTTDGNRTRYAGSGDLWITNSTVLNSTNILDMTVPLDLDAYIITGTLPWGNLPSGVASQEWVEAQGYVTNAIDVGTTNLTHYDTSEASASTLAATSAADRAYADTQDDSHSTADRQYTDQEVGDHADSQSAHHTRYTDVEAISAGASAGYISSTVINASNAVQDAVQTEHATNVLANVHGGELDPVASAEIATLTNDIANGATSYGWGDHSTNGYLSADAVGDAAYSNATDFVQIESDPIWGAVSNAITTNASNGNTAYGWGDHGGEGYLTAEADPLSLHTDGGGSVTGSITVIDAGKDMSTITIGGSETNHQGQLLLAADGGTVDVYHYIRDVDGTLRLMSATDVVWFNDADLAEIGTITADAIAANLAASTNLPLSGLAQSGATADQVPVWSGSAWTPQDQSGISGYVRTDGESVMTGDLNMGGFAVTSAADYTATGAVTGGSFALTGNRLAIPAATQIGTNATYAISYADGAYQVFGFSSTNDLTLTLTGPGAGYRAYSEATFTNYTYRAVTWPTNNATWINTEPTGAWARVGIDWVDVNGTVEAALINTTPTGE